jgi:hypothetical protein
MAKEKLYIHLISYLHIMTMLNKLTIIKDLD